MGIREDMLRGHQPQRPADVVDVAPEDIPPPSGESPMAETMIVGESFDIIVMTDVVFTDMQKRIKIEHGHAVLSSCYFCGIPIEKYPNSSEAKLRACELVMHGKKDLLATE